MTRSLGDWREPAHLRDASGFAPPVHRYAAPPALAALVRRFWLPVWSLPAGAVSVQRVLQYPVCQLVVAHEYAIVVGPHSGLNTQELRGSGWAAGAMLQPAAGSLLLGEPVAALRDCVRDLGTVPSVSPGLAEGVRAVMAPDPDDPGRHAEACALLGDALAALLPVDEEGHLVNAVVEYVEGDASVQRVAQVCEKFGLGERTLQRLCARRIGLSPKWLIQRRRLHEAAARLSEGERVDLARLAGDLGYADQAHLTRDWRSVTGVTPGAFAATPRGR